MQVKNQRQYLNQRAKGNSNHNWRKSKQSILWRLQHRSTRPDSPRCIHELEAEIARVKAVVTSDRFDFGVVDVG